MANDEKTYCVYKHTSPSGKVYIGITSQKPEYRWDNGNGYKGRTYFWNAIQKYGWENFEHEILYTGLSKQEAGEKEKELIQLYDSTDKNKGYNLSTGGEYGSAGVKQSQSTIDKRVQKLKGRTVSQEERDARSKFFKKLYEDKTRHPKYGTHWDEAGKEKLRQSAKNRPPISEKTRLKLKESHLGKEQTEDTKKKISKKNKGQKRTEETKQKISNSLKGKGHPQTEETKKKISENEKGKKISDKTKEKMRESANKTPIFQFNLDAQLIGDFDSIINASRVTGIPSANIGKCLHGKRLSAGGYIWITKDNYDDNILLQIIERLKHYPRNRGVKSGQNS